MHRANEHRRILVIGVGNRLRRDDGVGPVVSDLVRSRLESARQGKPSTKQESPGRAAAPRGAVPGGNLSSSISEPTLSNEIGNGLHEGFPGSCRIVEHSGEGASLMDAWRRDDAVIVIDASSSGRAAGTVIELDAHTSDAPSGLFRYSTHAFSVAEAIEMARILDRLPQRLRVFAIEGRDFRMGGGLTHDVEQAARVVADRVIECIRELHSEGRSRPEPCTNSVS